MYFMTKKNNMADACKENQGDKWILHPFSAFRACETRERLYKQRHCQRQ